MTDQRNLKSNEKATPNFSDKSWGTFIIAQTFKVGEYTVHKGDASNSYEYCWCSCGSHSCNFLWTWLIALMTRWFFATKFIWTAWEFIRYLHCPILRSKPYLLRFFIYLFLNYFDLQVINSLVQYFKHLLFSKHSTSNTLMKAFLYH